MENVQQCCESGKTGNIQHCCGLEVWKWGRSINQGKYKCALCSGQFEYRTNWLNHLKSHKKTCRLCGVIIYRRSTMVGHYLYLHNISLITPHCGG